MKYLVNLAAVCLLIFISTSFIQNVFKSKKKVVEKIIITPTPTLEIPSSTPAISPDNNITKPIIFRNYIFVSPNGNDSSDGKTQATALKSIQKAVDMALPGYTIELLPGEYFQDVVTKKDGLSDGQIIIKGQKNSVIKGSGKAKIFEINHSYITLDGFTIDGHFKQTSEASSYRDKLIYITGKTAEKITTNVKVFNMDIKNAGGECVRMRYLVKNSEIAYNLISICGVGDFEFNDEGKNGEGIYIGTAPEQRGDGKNPTSGVDNSDNNWIHHNFFNTQGNECVDIKEGSSFNIIENNKCTGQKDTNSGGMDSRGNENIFRYNEIYENLGAGIRLGGDEEKDGINNQVYDNSIINNKSGGIKFQRSPQGKVCGNKMEGNEKGNSVGSNGEDFNPEGSC